MASSVAETLMSVRYFPESNSALIFEHAWVVVLAIKFILT